MEDVLGVKAYPNLIDAVMLETKAYYWLLDL